jgi:alkylation response protein AidB-like acyl-CoA dehydrogenase
MDFEYPPEQEALRREVRAFISANMDDAIRAEMDLLREGIGVSAGRYAGSLIGDLFKKIGERGWLGSATPRSMAARAVTV